MNTIWIVTLILVAQIFVGLFSFLVWFYRDPHRTPPNEENVIVSPADGTVIYVKGLRRGEVPISVKGKKRVRLDELVGTDLVSNSGYHIGIFMSLFDVHVNRAPISGIVTYAKRTPEKFISTRKPIFRLVDERYVLIIDNGAIRVGVVQMAAYIVRTIKSYVKPDVELRIGERIGMLKLGSQVDVIIPDIFGVKLMVKRGSKLRAGESVIAKYND